MDNKEEEQKPKLKMSSLREAMGIFEFVLPYRWPYIIGLVLLFLSSSVFMIFPYIVGLMLDVAQGKEVPIELDLSQIAVILVVVLVFQGLVSYFRVTLFAKVSENTSADIRKAVYQKLITQPIVFFEKNRVGELVSRMTNDIEKIYNTLNFVLAEIIRQIIILVGGIGFLAFQTPKLAGVMLAVFPIIVIGAMIFGRRIRKLSKERQGILAETNTILDETLQSIYAVKAFTNELFESNRYKVANDRVIGVSMKYAYGRALFATFIITVLFGALFFVIWTGMSLVQSGEISAGQLISFVTFTAVIGAAIAGAATGVITITGAGTAIGEKTTGVATVGEASTGDETGTVATGVTASGLGIDWLGEVGVETVVGDESLSLTVGGELFETGDAIGTATGTVTGTATGTATGCTRLGTSFAGL